MRLILLLSQVAPSGEGICSLLSWLAIAEREHIFAPYMACLLYTSAVAYRNAGSALNKPLGCGANASKISSHNVFKLQLCSLTGNKHCAIIPLIACCRVSKKHLSLHQMCIRDRPWTRRYEDIRFWVLRPQVEATADQIIAEQSVERSPDGTVHLPWYDFFLSRYWGYGALFSSGRCIVLFYPLPRV